MAVTARVNNVLRRFGSGWALYFDAERVPARSYPRSTFPDRLSQLVDDERRREFAGRSRHFETLFRLTLTYLPPADSWSRASETLVERAAAEAGGSITWRTHLENFRARTDRAFMLLGDVMPRLAPMSDEATLTYLHGTVSASDGRITVPGIPAHLDAVLADTPLAGGIEPMLGDLHLRTLTVLGFPNLTRPGLLDDLNDLPFAYRWMTRFLVLGKDEAERELGRCRRQWFAKRKSVLAMLKEVVFSQEAALVNSDADVKAADADRALQELGEDLVAFGHVTTSVTVRHRSAAVAAEHQLELERILHGRGFATIRERLNAVEAWLGSLPGTRLCERPATGRPHAEPGAHDAAVGHLGWAGTERPSRWSPAAPRADARHHAVPALAACWRRGTHAGGRSHWGREVRAPGHAGAAIPPLSRRPGVRV